MAHSPSEKWENGVLLKRNIETNRWSVPADNADVEAEAEPAPKTKAVASTEAENKSVKAAAKK